MTLNLRNIYTFRTIEDLFSELFSPEKTCKIYHKILSVFYYEHLQITCVSKLICTVNYVRNMLGLQMRDDLDLCVAVSCLLYNFIIYKLCNTCCGQ